MKIDYSIDTWPTTHTGFITYSRNGIRELSLRLHRYQLLVSITMPVTFRGSPVGA